MNSLFPVADRDGHQLISVKGQMSCFYNITPIDLSQMDLLEVDNFYDQLGDSLNSLPESCFLKFYRLAGKNYLNTNWKQALNLNLRPEHNHLELFFGDEAFFSSIGIYDDYIGLNGQYNRIISVKNFPNESIGPFFLPENIDYVLNVKKSSQEKSLRRLERIRSAHQLSFSKAKTDFESEGAYSQAQDLIEELVHGEESLFNMELYFIVRAFSVEELNIRSKELINELHLKKLECFIEGHNLKRLKTGLGSIFSELIPGVRPSFRHRSIPNKTGHLKYLIPINESHLMNKGIELFDNSYERIYFDPFHPDFQNRNMLVTGSSGGGKSVFVNKLVHSLIDEHPIVILDKGGSFRRLCLYHGGIGLETGVNPMQFPNAEFLREFILSVVDGEKFKKLEKGKLLKEIKTFLKRIKDGSFWELLEYLKNTFPEIDLYFEDIKDFITDENLEFAPIFYVDIENYPKTQMAPLIIYLLEYFKNLPASEKILVFDECWQFLRDHAQYVDECFRTFRKSGAFPIAISQGLGDFTTLENGLYSSITNNSYFKIFFPQEQIQDPEICEFDNENIKALAFRKNKFSDCYLKTQDNKFRKVMRVLLTPLEKELFHTEAGEDQLFYKFFYDKRPYFPSNKETINAFVRLKYEA